MEKVKVDELVIDGTTYVPKESIKSIEGNIKIVILQRGWVYVGYFERNGSDCKLIKASNLRQWGTEGKGIGYIALNGPTDKTMLDKCFGVVEFDYLTVINTISCEVSKWENVL